MTDLRQVYTNSPTNSNTKVKVLEIRRVHDMGHLKAFIKCRVGPFVLHSCRLVQQPGQRPYAQLPLYQSGKKRGYYPIVSCDIPDLDTEIKQAIVEAWQQEQQEERAA